LKNLVLVIPTHNRVNKQITLAALPDDLRGEVILVPSVPEEAKELRRLYPDNDVVIARGTKSIAEKRHWIMKNLAGKFLFMMDDDIAFFERCPPKWRVWEAHRKAYALAPSAPSGSALMKRLYPGDKRLLELFQDVDKYVGKHPKLGMVGIAHRRHSDKKKEAWEKNVRMMYCFGVNKALYEQEQIRFTDVKLREDFHVVLSMLRKGHECHNYVELLNNEYGSFGAAGGCSGERSIEFSNEQCYALQKLHPAFVKVVDRAYTGSIPRKEVVIAWKKAYESSGANL
jgi:hypothetical protein